LGHNDKVNHSSPKQVGSLTNWATLANTGKNDVLNGAINTSGEMFMWGRNNDGQLGVNDNVDRSSPTQIPGTTWSALILNFSKGALAPKTDGTLWTWGENYLGQLGLNQPTSTKISSPTQIPGTWSTNKNHYATGSGGRTFAIKTDGTLWGWGTDNYGRLGLNGQAGPVTTQYKYSSPVQITTATNWTYLSSNTGNTAVINTSGELFVWGDNYRAQLGLNTQGTYFSSPTQIPGTTWSAVSATYANTMALKTDGTLWAWGYNSNGGQVGDNTTINRSSPVQIPGTNWSAIAGGTSWNAALKSDGTMWVWGYNYGNLAVGDTDHRSSPTQVPGTWGQIQINLRTTRATKVL